MSVIFNTSELNTIKKELPRGWTKIVKEKAKVGKSTITTVFKGTCKDQDIVDRVITEVIKLRNKNLKKADLIKKKISEAVS